MVNLRKTGGIDYAYQLSYYSDSFSNRDYVTKWTWEDDYHKEKPALPDHSLYLFFKNKQCIAIGQTVVPKSWDHIVLVQLPWDLEASHLSYLLQEQAESTGLTVEIDDSAKETILKYKSKVSGTSRRNHKNLGSIWLLFRKKQSSKEKAGKARHRWTKEVSEIPFTVNFRNSQATLYWISRNELLIKKGAILLAEAFK